MIEMQPFKSGTTYKISVTFVSLNRLYALSTFGMLKI